MTSDAPAVSVMLPVHNAARYLRATLESVLAQTFRDFEVVAIDDGSTDGSAAVLAEFARRDARVRFRGRENRGAVATRNEILATSRGQFVAANDADDLSAPDRFAAQVEFLRARPDVVCVGGHVDIIDARGRHLTTLRMPPHDEEIQSLLVLGHCTVQHSAAMVRRAALEAAGGYRARFPVGNDLDVFLRLGEVGRLANLDRVVARYRLHAASEGETRQLEQRALCRLACEEAWARRGIRATFEAARPTRPTPDRNSRHAFTLQWGWWAFNSGHRRTAAAYGARAVALRPFDARGWTLLGCAALKTAPGRARCFARSHPSAPSR